MLIRGSQPAGDELSRRHPYHRWRHDRDRLGFGAMRLCGPGVWGEPLDLPAAKRVLIRAVELGITLIDTADAYGPEVNERFIAETLYPYPKGS